MENMARVACAICGQKGHILASHIVNDHGIKLDDYLAKHGAFMSAAAAKKIKAMTAEAENEKIETPIKALFGLALNSKKINTWQWKFPHKTTPAIDPDYVFRREIIGLLIMAHENQSERVLFVGPTGSGKSSGVIQGAARFNVPFYRVNLDNEVTKPDFIGQYVLVGNETVYQYGTLPLAMKQGAWLLVDEWDMGNPGVTAVLQAVLEGNPLLIPDTGEIVYPAEGFRIFATGNTIGQGDETGLYAGTQVQNFAQLDRFTLVETVDYPVPSVEKAIVAKQCSLTDDAMKQAFGIAEVPQKDNADAIVAHIVNVANLVRKSFVKEEVGTTMSTRTLVNIGRKFLILGDIKRAYQVAYLNKLTKDDRSFVEEIIQREWGV